MYERENENSANEYHRAVRATSENETEKVSMELFDWLSCIVTALIFGVLIFVFVGRTIGVDGISMQQTLYDNDRVIMSNLMYTPSNGDIIIFHSPADKFGGIPLVKRVVAIGGQTLDISPQNGDVIVDGVVVDEPYIFDMTTALFDFSGPMYIPEGYVFVLGDNRERTSDSRQNSIGLVDTRYILGQVHFILFPGADELGNRDWSRIGFVR